MTTERDLAELNALVYAVDPGYENNKIFEVGTIVENTVLPGLDSDFFVLSTKNGDWGFKGMAVAPIVDGVPDTSQVVIVAAGTDPSKPEELLSAGSEWVGLASKQTEVAAKYVNEVIKNNPDWSVTQLTGYSQSAYMLKVGARNSIPTTVFNGWFNYSNLTYFEEISMKYNSEMFINYKPNKDWIARATDVGWFGSEMLRTARKNMDNLGYSKLTGEGYDTLIRLEGNSHDLSSWQFDEQGRILIADTEKNQNKRLKQRQQAIAVNYRKSVAFLIRLKRKFQTKGPITPNEQIYLDDSKALAFVEKVATEYKMNCQDVIQSLRQSIDDIEQPWVDIQTEAFRVGTLLTQSEVYEAMESVGVTKQSVVLEPLEEYTDMLNEWLEKEKDFDALIEKIKTSIAKLVELDEDLARQISS